MRELGRDGRVQRLHIAGVAIDVGREAACVLLEDDFLVPRLVDEFGSLEVHLPGPLRCLPAGLNQSANLGFQPLVFGVEDRMHRGQRVVLIEPAVATDEVNVEQFVVVKASRWSGRCIGRCAHPHERVGVRREHRPRRALRVGGIAHVVQECQAGALHDAVDDDQLRLAVGIGNEAAIGIDKDLRQVQNVQVGQRDADALCIDLDVEPGRQPAGDGALVRRAGVLEQPAGGHAIGVVLAQQDRHHRVRAVGRPQIDERRHRVGVDAIAIGGDAVDVGARKHHEVRRCTCPVQRVPGKQRHVDDAVVALLYQVQVVSEELAEHREETARRQCVELA